MKQSVISVLCVTLFGFGMLGTCQAAGGDPAVGKTKADTCLGCHGVQSYTNVYPTYNVPKLGGQHPDYIIAALKAYKAGERDHPTMQAQASTLSDQDMADVAAYFASIK
jgi:cytochrome c553